MIEVKKVRSLGDLNGHELQIVSYTEYGIMYGNKIVKYGISREQAHALTLDGAQNLARSGIAIYLQHEEKLKQKNN